MKKFFLYALLSILTAMCLLNPSMKKFKEFTGELDYFYKTKSDIYDELPKFQIVRKRTFNFLLLSIYEIGESDTLGEYTSKSRYVGILSNFIKI